MHEMALAEGILGVVLQAADGEPVRRVRLRIGALQRVVPDSLQFCFQLAADGTPAAETYLELDETPARLRCQRCDAVSEFRAPPFQCRPCGAYELDVVAGDEVLVDGVELDSGWRYRPGASGGEAVDVDVPADHLREHALAESAGHPHEHGSRDAAGAS